MNISSVEIVDRGISEKERIVLLVEADDQIGRYVILLPSRTRDGRIAGGKQKSAYWIPDQEVKAGDKVVVYTKTGVIAKKENANGSNSYFFYWNLLEPVLGNPEDRVVLTRIGTWRAFPKPYQDVDTEEPKQQD